MTHWTTERVSKLKYMHTMGLTASQIAHRLGHVTRNAVVGKIHRLGLPTRGMPSLSRPIGAASPNWIANRSAVISAGQRKSWQYGARAPYGSVGALDIRNTPPRRPAKPLPVDTSGEIPSVRSVMDLQPHHCRWVHGDPQQPGWGYCGAQRVPGSAYCVGHYARSIELRMPSLQRRKAA